MIHPSHSFSSYKRKNQPIQLAIVIALHVIAVWMLVLATDQGMIKRLISPAQVVLLSDEDKPPLALPKPTKPVVKQTVPKPDLDIVRESSSAVTVDFTDQKIADSAPHATPSPKMEAAMICPTQVKPEIPRVALVRNIQGLIKVEAVVVGGAVKEVHFISGPRIFYDSVRAAMLQYGCAYKADPVLAVQEFNFRFE
jgi:protein TonB